MIRMKETKAGSPDGVTVQVYEEGKEYALDRTASERSLADVFVKVGWAEPVEQKVQKAAPRNKALGAAPQNKGKV